MWPASPAPIIGGPAGRAFVLDRGHPLARGLVVCAPLQRSLYDPAANRMYSMLGSGQSWVVAPPAPQAYNAVNFPTRISGNPREGMNFNGTSGAGLQVNGSGPMVGGSFAWTVMAGYAVSVGTANVWTLYGERASTGNDYVLLQTGSTGTGATRNWVGYQNDAGTTQQINTGPDTLDGLYHVQTGTKLGTLMSLYIDGVLQNTATFGSSSDAFTNAGIISGVGYNAGNLSTSMNGVIYFCYAWRRCLSAFEVRSMSFRPWQIFRPLGAHIAPQAPSGAFPEYFWLMAA